MAHAVLGLHTFNNGNVHTLAWCLEAVCMTAETAQATKARLKAANPTREYCVTEETNGWWEDKNWIG